MKSKRASLVTARLSFFLFVFALGSLMAIEVIGLACVDFECEPEHFADQASLYFRSCCDCHAKPLTQQLTVSAPAIVYTSIPGDLNLWAFSFVESSTSPLPISHYATPREPRAGPNPII